MRIRVIDLANNFYKDTKEKKQQNDLQDEDEEQVLGEYCCLGYFDALNIWKIECGELRENEIRKKVNQIVMNGLDGSCNRKSIICITDNDTKDECFWEQAKKMPFLFVSLVRINPTFSNSDESKTLITAIKEINLTEDVIAYYTYDHSDMVLLKYGENYLQDLEMVLSLYHSINVFKMYSVFAVREEVLNNCENIVDAKVNCRLSITVKDMSKVDDFLANLGNFLYEKNECYKKHMKCYDTLGNSDLLVEISQVSIRKLLCCYKMGQILTHINDFYKDALYNVESQIFAKSGRGWNMDVERDSTKEEKENCQV